MNEEPYMFRYHKKEWDKIPEKDGLHFEISDGEVEPQFRENGWWCNCQVSTLGEEWFHEGTEEYLFSLNVAWGVRYVLFPTIFDLMDFYKQLGTTYYEVHLSTYKRVGHYDSFDLDEEGVTKITPFYDDQVLVESRNPILTNLEKREADQRRKQWKEKEKSKD